MLVVRRVTQLLAERLRADMGRVEQYECCNQEGDWELPPSTNPLKAAEVAEAEEAEFLGLVADLDTVLLSTVEDLACPVEALAGILQDALRTSLWKRRLNRKPLQELALQQAVLTGRARWIWKGTTPVQRKACFASGVGYAAGWFIDKHLEELISGLVRAEQSIRARRRENRD